MRTARTIDQRAKLTRCLRPGTLSPTPPRTYLRRIPGDERRELRGGERRPHDAGSRIVGKSRGAETEDAQVAAEQVVAPLNPSLVVGRHDGVG